MTPGDFHLCPAREATGVPLVCARSSLGGITVQESSSAFSLLGKTYRKTHYSRMNLKIKKSLKNLDARNKTNYWNDNTRDHTPFLFHLRNKSCSWEALLPASKTGAVIHQAVLLQMSSTKHLGNLLYGSQQYFSPSALSASDDKVQFFPNCNSVLRSE